MGVNISKSGSKQGIVSKNDKSICTDENRSIFLDPRSPNINRTRILSNRLDCIEQTPKADTQHSVHDTPMNSSKQKGHLDPRSPSQFIPRTPLNMSLSGDDIEKSNGQYSVTYSGYIEEASCRNFNERLENITFDDSFAEMPLKKTLPKIESIGTPMEKQFNTHVDTENISPLRHSTPFQHVKIFTDPYSTLDCVTPVKKNKNIKERRTPFESLVNRRAKSIESLLQQDSGKKPVSKINNEDPRAKQCKHIIGSNQKKYEVFCD